MMRGGGRRSVKYEEVITLVAAGRTYLETKVRNEDGCRRAGVAGRGLEHRKGGVVRVVAVGGRGARGGSRLRVVEVEDSKFSEA